MNSRFLLLFIITFCPNVPVWTLRRFYKKKGRESANEKKIAWMLWFWNHSQKSTLFYKPFCLKLLDTSPCTDTVFLPSHYYREVQLETQIHELANVTSLNKWTHFKWLAHFKDWYWCLYFCLNRRNIILMVFNFFLLIHWLIIRSFSHCLPQK